MWMWMELKGTAKEKWGTWWFSDYLGSFYPVINTEYSVAVGEDFQKNSRQSHPLGETWVRNVSMWQAFVLCSLPCFERWPGLLWTLTPHPLRPTLVEQFILTPVFPRRMDKAGRLSPWFLFLGLHFCCEGNLEANKNHWGWFILDAAPW